MNGPAADLTPPPIKLRHCSASLFTHEVSPARWNRVRPLCERGALASSLLPAGGDAQQMAHQEIIKEDFECH